MRDPRGDARRAAVLLLIAGLLWAAGAAAQTDLGGQRAGTASGTFLKIGLSARGAAFAGAYGSLVRGAESVFQNPAGMSLETSPSLSFGYVDWIGDIQIASVAHSRYIDALASHVGIGIAGMSTTLDETDEFHPLGTGREFSFSDFVTTLCLSRHFTDRLTIGVSVKYFRETLGTEIGGPSIHAVLFDAGNVYRLGFRDARLAISMTNFGGDLEPRGGFDSHVQGTEVNYTGFSAPTVFRISFAVDAWRRGSQALWAVGEIQNTADNEETLVGAFEWTHGDVLALRGGYNLNSDVFQLAVGGGLSSAVGGTRLAADYAYNQGDYLEDVHRWSVTFSF